MFGTLFCVAVSAGLRSGEARALHRNQISIANSGLVIDRALDDLGQIGPLKKATKEDPRSRVVIIPELTLKTLERWLDRAPGCPDYPGLVFSYRSKPIASYYLLDRFRFGLDRLGYRPRETAAYRTLLAIYLQHPDEDGIARRCPEGVLGISIR
jgi:integrase